MRTLPYMLLMLLLCACGSASNDGLKTDTPTHPLIGNGRVAPTKSIQQRHAEKTNEGPTLFYLPNEDKPFTGTAVSEHDRSEQIYQVIEISEGQLHGSVTILNQNGEKTAHWNYNKGVIEGDFFFFPSSSEGEPLIEGSFKDGKLVKITPEYLVTDNGMEELEKRVRRFLNGSLPYDMQSK